MRQSERLGPTLRGEVSHLDGDVVLRLAGELDLPGGDALVARTAEIAGDVGGDVVIDMEDITFIDSCGIRALLLVRGAAAEAGSTVRLDNVPPDVRRLLSLVGLTDTLRIEG